MKLFSFGSGDTTTDSDSFMLEDEVSIIKDFHPASLGHFAFFVDEDDDTQVWAERIIAWGTFHVWSSIENESNTEVRGMILESELGTLNSDYIDEPNYLGTFYSQNLAGFPSYEITQDHIPNCDIKLWNHLVSLINDRKDATLQRSFSDPNVVDTVN